MDDPVISKCVCYLIYVPVRDFMQCIVVLHNPLKQLHCNWRLFEIQYGTSNVMRRNNVAPFNFWISISELLSI